MCEINIDRFSAALKVPTLLVPFPAAPPPLNPLHVLHPLTLLLFTFCLPKNFLWGGVCSCCGLVLGGREPVRVRELREPCWNRLGEPHA